MQRMVLLGLASATVARSAFFVSKGSPVTKVVELINELKARIESDGEKEQKGYDKFACWCEDTLVEKANDITNGKATIESLEKSVKSLMAALAVHFADIDQIKKDIAANEQAQREAKGLRKKENEEFTAEKEEAEQVLGALEAAIGALTGAGEKKKGFLETLQEAQLISAAAGIKSVLGMRAVREGMVSEEDMQLMHRFVEKPQDFEPGRHMSAMQVAQNPFGDYAPKSGQIQRVLKGMYDGFANNLEKANAEEATKEKAFRALMETKEREHKTLKDTLESKELDNAEKTKSLADDREALDDSRRQLKDDEEFLARSKKDCKTKASQWSTRMRLRTEELQGINTAIEILTSDEAKATFSNASSTFLQIDSIDKRTQAYKVLHDLAVQHKSQDLAKVAQAARSGRHFNKVINMIDKMVQILKEENQADIEHRDRCEAKLTENKQATEDLEYDIDKVSKEIGRKKDDEKLLKETIEGIEEDIDATKKEMEEAADNRANENANLGQAVQDDINAIKLLSQAIASLSKFYKNNKIPLSLAQGKKAEPAPDAGFDENYGGRNSESGGIVAILEMIKEDLEKEVKDTTGQELTATNNFASDRKAMQNALKSQKESLVVRNKELVVLEQKILHDEADKGQSESDKDIKEEEKEALDKDCGWIETDFEARKEKRAQETAGLIEAKNFLAGMV